MQYIYTIKRGFGAGTWDEDIRGSRVEELGSLKLIWWYTEVFWEVWMVIWISLILVYREGLSDGDVQILD